MIFDKSRILPIGLATVFLTAPALVHAGTDSGFYVGGGVGYTAVEIDGDGDTFDESDTSYKVFGGYNFGLVPFLDIAAEVSYVNFGNPSGLLDDTAAGVEITGFDVFGLVGFDLGPVGIFAKAGLINWDADVSYGGDAGGDDGSDPAYGIGAKFQIGSFAVRGEFEYFDVESVKNLSMLSVSGVFTF
ncbi:MAG: porin family protein [Pseudomonadales bacterium]|nr:porin family protein [Pseudomonadales bacterium]